MWIFWDEMTFDLYLYGTLKADQTPLEILKFFKFDHPRIMRWVLGLQSFIFRVEQRQRQCGS